jgi:hypothetical protein
MESEEFFFPAEDLFEDSPQQQPLAHGERPSHTPHTDDSVAVVDSEWHLQHTITPTHLSTSELEMARATSHYLKGLFSNLSAFSLSCDISSR